MKYIFLFGVLMSLMFSCKEAESYSFSIEGKTAVSQAAPVSVNLETIGLKKIGGLSEFVLSNDGEQIPFQVDNDNKTLWFVHLPQRTVNYTLKRVEVNTQADEGVSTIQNNGDLHLSIGDIPVLTYRYGMSYPPKGVDSIFRKSAYIHPLLSPAGDTLTRIQPPDHYHHYGIWGPWTHTRIEGERIDFWNLVEGQGTVLFNKFNDTFSGPVFAGFNAHQEHINLKASQDKQIALNENLEVKLWDLGRSDRYMVDYISTFNTPLESGILLEAYRYGGGLGMRFTERWKKDNCSVLTSEGKDRLSADGTNARWCMVTGEASTGEGANGILFLSYPENRAHPEPMRIWPIDANGGRGDMFFEFCPIRHKEWNIEPNKDYRLKYRMVVFEGELSPEEAEGYWKAYADAPIISTK